MINTVWFHLYEVPRVIKIIETERRMWLPGAGRRENREYLLNGHRVSVLQDERVLKRDEEGCKQANLWAREPNQKYFVNVTDYNSARRAFQWGHQVQRASSMGDILQFLHQEEIHFMSGYGSSWVKETYELKRQVICSPNIQYTQAKCAHGNINNYYLEKNGRHRSYWCVAGGKSW